MGKIIEVDTSGVVKPEADSSIYKTRENFVSSSGSGSDVTIIVQAYNRIDKTKRCIESLLKYTSDVDFELWLIDSGTTDGTFEYFKSVPYEKKNILRLSENKGAPYPFSYMDMSMLCPYVCYVANDLVLTKGWLRNLLTVIESDKRIGMVCPLSSNASNFQDPHLEFSDYEDMQKKAEEFNVSNPVKWEERIRLVTLGPLFRKECLYAVGFPFFDVGFTHNFGDDDLSFRVRRAGYKTILAGDTWIHHDDEKTAGVSPERAIVLKRDMEEGRKKFKDKYFGVDAWGNENGFVPEFVNAIDTEYGKKNVKLLGIDVGCGMPLLDIKNHLRAFNIFDPECFAYTNDGKYVTDLQTICGGDNVLCGDAGAVSSAYEPGTFDQIVVGRDINTYPEPLKMIRKAAELLTTGGQLFFMIYNAAGFLTFLNILGKNGVHNTEKALYLTVEELAFEVKQLGYEAVFLGARRFEKKDLTDETEIVVRRTVDMLPVANKEEALFRLFSERYCFVITNKKQP